MIAFVHNLDRSGTVGLELAPIGHGFREGRPSQR